MREKVAEVFLKSETYCVDSGSCVIFWVKCARLKQKAEAACDVLLV